MHIPNDPNLLRKAVNTQRPTWPAFFDMAAR